MDQNKLFQRLYLNAVAGLNALDRICIEDIVNGEILPTCLSQSNIETLAQKRIDPSQWNPESWKRKAEELVSLCEKQAISCISFFDKTYPKLLRETSRPPYLLFVRGNYRILNMHCITIVGTRYPTGLGFETARELGKTAGEHNLVVISGLARGIDTASHVGALYGNGYTVAVLGSGIDYIYPAGNKGLAEKIIASGGALVSEYPCGYKPGKYTFPERNRILAGLSHATIVVEAPERSGALITADFAVSEGRDVFVSARCINSVRSAGCRTLESDGARLLDSIDEILEQYTATSLLL